MANLLIIIAINILTDLFHLGGIPHILEQDSVYERMALTDSTYMEIYKGDSIYVVFTACAPQCSSYARVFNKEWQLLGTVNPPFTSIFPLATIDKTTGRIIWTDNDTWNYQFTW
jgi:hypothetical protein